MRRLTRQERRATDRDAQLRELGAHDVCGETYICDWCRENWLVAMAEHVPVEACSAPLRVSLGRALRSALVV